MSTPELSEPQQISEAYQARRLRNGLISLAVLVALVVGLVLAVPGLHGVGDVVADMAPAGSPSRSRSRSSRASATSSSS